MVVTSSSLQTSTPRQLLSNAGEYAMLALRPLGPRGLFSAPRRCAFRTKNAPIRTCVGPVLLRRVPQYLGVHLIDGLVSPVVSLKVGPREREGRCRVLGQRCKRRAWWAGGYAGYVFASKVETDAVVLGLEWGYLVLRHEFKVELAMVSSGADRTVFASGRCGPCTPGTPGTCPCAHSGK